MTKFLFILFALTLCFFAVNLRQPKVAASASIHGELVSINTEIYDDGSYFASKLTIKLRYELVLSSYLFYIL